MPTMEEAFDKACKDRIIPGAILLATDKTGVYASRSVHVHHRLSGQAE